TKTNKPETGQTFEQARRGCKLFLVLRLRAALPTSTVLLLDGRPPPETLLPVNNVKRDATEALSCIDCPGWLTLLNDSLFPSGLVYSPDCNVDVGGRRDCLENGKADGSQTLLRHMPRVAARPHGSTPQVTFPPGAGHDRYEENFNGPATYAEPYVERYGIKSDFSGREPLHPTPPRPGYVPTLGQTPPSSTQGSVMMVYGLQPDKVNTDKLFNLFCLYGNVTKVKFLKTKEGCAMIQMGDSIAVERCLQNLNNVTIGTDGRLQLGFSKQAFLSDVTNPYILPDKTASFKDFTGSKNNRFLNPAMANKNRIQPPSKIVHFFNTPPDLTEETVNRVFVERGIEAPTTIKLFPLKSERSSSGLIEFSSVGIAVAAIMECNHTALENSNGKFPYIMKLCFSSSRTIPTSFPPSSGSVSSNSAGNGHAKMQQDSE
ncbi:Heterogeneous nuclear ribonucleoprotein L, partial [Trachymyrmex cornetzi]